MERFVEGLTGTSILEICALCATAPLGLGILRSYYASQGGANQVPHRVFIVEFICLVAPIVLCCTLASDYLLHALLGMLVVALCADRINTIDKGTRATTDRRTGKCGNSSTVTKTRHAFISWYRGNVMIITCVCILAVDFRVFPRRYGKTEIYGTGLMDMGVGSFVFSSALVSRASRADSKRSKGTEGRGLISASRLRRIVQVFFLGTLRAAVHYGIDYQTHISEYGVHWNFFFTLLVIMLFATLPISPSTQWLVGIAVAVIYQWLLVVWEIDDYILNAPRENMFSANREGILGSLGFVAIYALTVGISRTFVHCSAISMRRLVALDVALWFFTLVTATYVDEISRRMVNLAYIFWVLAHNVMMLVFLLAVQRRYTCGRKLAGGPATGLLEVLSRNQLAVFLVANLGTGAVNHSMKTIRKGPVEGTLVVLLYMSLVCVFAKAWGSRYVQRD